ARRRSRYPARNPQTSAEFHGKQQRRAALAFRTNSVTVSLDSKHVQVTFGKGAFWRLHHDNATGWVNAVIGQGGQHRACVRTSAKFGRAVLSEIDVIELI